MVQPQPPEPRTVAYFSMEVGLESEMPTYSGGLGSLAGDTVRAAADLRVPMVAVTLLHRKGYFYQVFDATGWQKEQPAEWVVEDRLRELPQRVAVYLEGRTVRLRAWQYDVTGVGGYVVPVYFLDADLPENAEADRRLTDCLYGGDTMYRFCQEVILGMGGVRLLLALGHDRIQRFHMNEGHAALLTVELLEEEARRAGREVISCEDIEAVHARCVFTTHTPVAAGHDQFPMDLVHRVLGPRQFLIDLKDLMCVRLVERVLNESKPLTDMSQVFAGNHVLNMTYLALNLSRYVNGVAKKHGEVSRLMFANYPIDAITNGVHAATWVSPPLRDLYDRHVPGWRADNFSLRYALSIPNEEFWRAHAEAKRNLIQYANRETNAGLSEERLTLGFARRATGYKRWDLILDDVGRLRDLGSKGGGVQIIFAGKAHPHDEEGKRLIQRVLRAREELHDGIRIAYLPNYDIDLAKLMTAGSDVWLNTPQPPLEASGTSGMKAALNGVPSLSVLDGWWVEGCIEGVTGWAIDGTKRGGDPAEERKSDAASLYDKLENVVLPLFYQGRDRFLDVMRHAAALNGSFFNTQRMMQQYVLKAYFR